jgi:hypothetical protein
MPSANECELQRVFVRNSGGTVTEESIKDNATFEVVLDLEAGSAIFASGAQFKLFAVVNDLSTSTTAFTSAPVSGSLGGGSADWPTLAFQHVFTVPAQTAAKDDHLYQAFGLMSVGVSNPIVDAEQSDIFVITQP